MGHSGSGGGSIAREALRVAGIYAVVAGLWIVLSDSGSCSRSLSTV